MTMTLTADCTTDETILVPDGFTLDGNGHTITVPVGTDFAGAIVANAGTEAHVTRLTIDAGGLANVCDAGDDRLRAIMFDGASGSITHNTVLALNQGASGCQEGNAIEARNAPFDGTHPGTVTVEIAHNSISNWQKTGIVANGDVDASIHHNNVGASATQASLAPNGIQLGFGAMGSITHNHVAGNQWLGASNFAGTAILVFDADGAVVSNNNIDGNSDVGIFAIGDGGTYDNNRIFDYGDDGPHGDFGFASIGDNTVTLNKVRGFDVPYFGVSDGKNITIGEPQPQTDEF